MVADPVRAIADAVLYEGYILWPYRRSALKNRQRFTFGGVLPRGHTEGRDDDPWRMRAGCLVEAGEDATLEVRVRFLHVVRRQAMRHGPAGAEPVDELTVGGRRHLSWQEAREREVALEPTPLRELRSPIRVAIELPAGAEEEELRDAAGRRAGAVVRSWHRLRGELEVAVEPAGPGLRRVSATISNTTPWHGGSRADAVERGLCSTHAVMRTEGGAFVSMTDPPPALREAAAACRNEGAWPVLVGEPGERGTMLAAPIILEDHPRVAPESPGDLFDGAEIDGLLTLSILSLSEEEKAEMRDTDPRAREILERTDALSPEELMRLHGAIREFQVRR